MEISKGDKIKVDGKVYTVSWNINGKLGTEEGIIIPVEDAKVVQRAMFRSRLTKQIKDMSEEELRTYIATLRESRANAMQNSLSLKETKPRKSAPKKATSKPLEKTEKALRAMGFSEKELEALRNRIRKG